MTLASLAATLTIALAGCAASDSGGTLSAATAAPSSDVVAAWLNDGGSIALVTWGSSSAECIPTAADVTGSGQTVDVTLALPRAEAICTPDFVPRGTYVSVPTGVDATRDATVTYHGAKLQGRATLPGDATLTGQPTDGLPSASWFAPHRIVLLTWGSSSCPPVVEEIAAAGDGATVSFQADAAKVCTMDYAPRLTMLEVTAPANRAGYTLHLVGGGLDGETTVTG